MQRSRLYLPVITLIVPFQFIQIDAIIPPFNFLLPSYKHCNCGVANDNRTRDIDFLKIIGGRVNGYHEFPWLVQVLHDNVTVCGGSIVSDSFVLTAAHCFRNDFEQKNFKVVVGQHDMCSNSNDVVVLSVRKLLRHEDFDIRTYYADVMLLKLSMRLTFSKIVAPICLPKLRFDVQQVFYGRKALISGWGVYREDSLGISCEPRKAYVPITPKQECNSSLASSLFCAGYPAGGSGFCDGDSGGPLQFRNDYGQYELVGIISNSFGCAQAEQYGFYTDVSFFLPWILRNIYGSRWCY